MSNTDEWVSHNLQRQRKILEEKQRQRRMQSTGIYSSNQATGHQNHPAQYQSEMVRSSSTSASSSGFHSSSFGGGSSMDRASTNNSRGGMRDPGTPSNPSSLYSFVDKASNQTTAPPRSYGEARQRSSTANQQSLPTSFEGPKIITVKGITPPQSRKQSVSDEEDAPLVYGQQRSSSRPKTAPRLQSGVNNWQQTPPASSSSPFATNSRSPAPPHRPVVNVSRLDAMSRTDSSGCINSDAEEDNNENNTRRKKSVKKKEGGGEVSNGKANGGTGVPHKQPWEDEDEDDQIPTEVMDNENPIEVADIVNNLDQFVIEPTKKNVTLKCKITRDKKGVDKGMFPIYYLHLEKSDGRRIFLLAARRRKKSATANYLISTDPTDLSRNAKSFIAKVRSNAMGTSFTIYDNGENPKKTSVIGDSIRQELAAVIYETNVLGLKGPRKMTIIIPGIYSDEKHNYVRPIVVRPISERDSILERHKTHRLDEMVVLNNKQPVWNEDTQSYVLNFHGRVTQASVKNFQIVHCLSNNESAEEQKNRHYAQAQNTGPGTISRPPINNLEPAEYIVMQFGRIDNESFTMDIRYPLSPVQAFGIGLYLLLYFVNQFYFSNVQLPFEIGL